MRYITASDGVRLYVEEAGRGDPILFLHEYGGDHLSWELQIRYFSRWYRCITFAARGWPPSDVPSAVERYSQERAADDAADVLDALDIPAAHLVGLSMGATAALEFGIRHPQRATSLTVAGGGGGGSSDPEKKEKHRRECETFAALVEEKGLDEVGEFYCLSPTRIQFRKKDPRGWAEFRARFATGSAEGHALTMRGIQALRQPFYERDKELRELDVPVMVVVGDEDDATVDLAVFLKRTLPRCGLLTMPNTGHTINLEEPALFNAALERFIKDVEKGQWGGRGGAAGYNLIRGEKE